MRLRLFLVALVALGLGACAEAPDAPPQTGTESPVQVPVETPPGVLTVPGGAEPGREPGAPGSDVAEAAWALDGGACYVYDSYIVRTEPRPSAPGEDVYVFRRQEGDAREQCGAPSGDALFAATAETRAEFFFGLVGDRLLLDEGTGPNGRIVRVVDLPSMSVLHEARYEEPVEVRDGALLYGVASEAAESVEELKALGATCPEAEEWLSGGLAVGLSRQTRYDFAAGTVEPTGEVLCVPIQ